MGKALGDVLAQATDADDDLRLVIDATQMIGDEEGLSLIEDGGVGLGEDDGLIRALNEIMQLTVVGCIIHTYSEDLH